MENLNDTLKWELFVYSTISIGPLKDDSTERDNKSAA